MQVCFGGSLIFQSLEANQHVLKVQVSVNGKCFGHRIKELVSPISEIKAVNSNTVKINCDSAFGKEFASSRYRNKNRAENCMLDMLEDFGCSPMSVYLKRGQGGISGLGEEMNISHTAPKRFILEIFRICDVTSPKSTLEYCSLYCTEFRARLLTVSQSQIKTLPQNRIPQPG